MSNCACVYSDYDGDGACEFSHVEAVEVRRCGECERPIKIGERYLLQWYWEESLCPDCEDPIDECQCYPPDDEMTMCSDCESIVDQLFCGGWAFRHVLTDLREHIENVGADILSCDMGSLTKRARGMICDMIEEQWNRDDED